jgi:hypothetical protein
MFPQELSNARRADTPSHAEIRLYDQIAEDLDDSWTVFYSVAWQDKDPRTGASRDGEIDFILAHPDLGVLTIEVKGGRISYDGSRGSWLTTDSKGQSFEIRPFDEARKAKYSLINYLAQGNASRVAALKRAVYDCVCFPDCVVPAAGLPPEAPRDMVIDGADLADIEQALRRVFAYHCGSNARKLTSGAALIAEVEKRVAPQLTMPNPLAVELVSEHREFVRLTEHQFELLHLLRRRRRLAICGCAGSGKTMMAMEKARQLASDGFRTLLTCFNKGLAGYLAERAKGLSGVTVLSYHGLCQELAHEAGVELKQGAWENYPDALCAAVELKPELTFDAVLVDEAQDFKETWWVSILSLFRDEQQGILYVFYDDNQQIYGRDQSLPEGLEIWPLDENVRNTRSIFRCVAPLYTGAEEVRPRGPSGRTVESHVYSDDEDMRRLLSRVVHRLVEDERIDPSQIVVLTPKSKSHSRLSSVTKLGSTNASWDDDPARRSIRISTINSFKGLERSIVIACELDDQFLARDEHDNLAYVAFSRPQHHLIVLGTKQALESVIRAQRSGAIQ